MTKLLKLIHAIDDSSSKHYQLKVELKSEHLQKIITVTCQAPLGSAWHTQDSFDIDSRKNWGLWNFDVIEIFWQNRQEANQVQAPYHEWQIAPNNKSFCLDISLPSISYSTPLICPIKFQSQIQQSKWIASFIIPEIVYKNFKFPYLGVFAILGQGPDKAYYALNLPVTSKPNFHLPQFFLPISELS